MPAPSTDDSARNTIHFLTPLLRCRMVITHRGPFIHACLMILQWAEGMNRSLAESDPELLDIIEKEKLRQRQSLVLIASEVCSTSAYD